MHVSLLPSRPRVVASLAALAVGAGLACGGLVVAPATAATAAVAPMTADADPANDPYITGHPSGAQTTRGDTVLLDAYAAESSAAVRWQRQDPQTGSWVDFTGGQQYSDPDLTSTFLRLQDAAWTDSGVYRAVFTDATPDAVEHPTLPATVEIATTPPQVTTTSYSYSDGFVMEVYVTEGYPNHSAVQWQELLGDDEGEGGTWTDLDGAVSTRHEVAKVAYGEATRRFRAVVTSPAYDEPVVSEVLSAVGEGSAPTITQSPQADVDELVPGEPVTLTSTAEGDPAPTVQWQVQRPLDEGDLSEWADVPGATSGSHTFTPTKEMNGERYRTVWTNELGETESDAYVVDVEGVEPGEVGDLTVAQSVPGSLQVGWTAPTDLGTPARLTGYTVRWSKVGSESGGGTTVAADATSYTITGLSSGYYDVRVAARNAYDAGSEVGQDRVQLVGAGDKVATITSTTTSAVAGQRVTLSGVAEPEAVLYVDYARPGLRYSEYVQVTANSLGRWTTSFNAFGTASWRVRTVSGKVSAGRSVAVRNGITMAATRNAVRTYTLSGAVTPASNGQGVTIYQQSGSSWVRLATVRTNARGQWSYRKTWSASRTYTLKAVSADTAWTEPGSVTKAVAVR